MKNDFFKYVTNKYRNFLKFIDTRCPKCRSSNFYKRRYIKPIYRCKNCKHTFNEPGVNVFFESDKDFIKFFKYRDTQ
jgi:ribosomal protein L37AE/L43A